MRRVIVDSNKRERLVLQQVGKTPTHIDVIVEKVPYTYREVEEALLALEQGKVIRYLPGKRFISCDP